MDLQESIDKLYTKYKLDILSVLNWHLLQQNEGKSYEELYDKDDLTLKRQLYNKLKDIEINAKNVELGGEGRKLLTKEQLEKWLNDGESYVSIARKYIGVSEKIIADYAKTMNIAVERQKSNNIEYDTCVADLIKGNTIKAILLSLNEKTIVLEKDKVKPKSTYNYWGNMKRKN